MLSTATGTIFAFFGGAMSGSFLSVVAHRVPRGESIVAPRSRCSSCGVTIAAYDNIPIVSWLLLRGRCRSCGARIPARYPLVEIATGLAFAATVLVFHDEPAQLVLGLVLVATLAAITLTDLELRLIPNRILLVVGDRRRRARRGPGPGEPAGTGDRRGRRPAGSSSRSPSPIRGGWGWATSSSPR